MLDFRMGDLAAIPFFMAAVRERFEISVAFDVLLHQPPLLAALPLVVEKTERAICIVQPMLKKRDVPNSLVYPGNADVSQLAPVWSDDQAGVRAFSVEDVNHSHWIWGMTRSFFGSVLAGEGFEVTREETGDSLPSANWFRYG